MEQDNPYATADYAPDEPAPPQPKRPMLSWWALIPTAICVVLQAIVAWPMVSPPHDQAHGMGYLVGRTISGPLIAAIIAWLPYRLLGRSQLAGTLTYSVLVLLVAVAPGRILLNEQAAPIRHADFEFEKPAGWGPIRVKQPETVAAIALRRDMGADPEALIQIDVVENIPLSPRQLATNLAREHGEISLEEFQLDGVELVRGTAPSNDLSRPRLIAVAKRNGKMYVILGAVTQEVPLAEGFEHVLKTWRWRESP